MSSLAFTEKEIAYLVENTKKIMNKQEGFNSIEQPYFLINNEFHKTQEATEAFKKLNINSDINFIEITDSNTRYHTQVLIIKDNEYKYLVYNKYKGTIDCTSLDSAIDIAFDYFS